MDKPQVTAVFTTIDGCDYTHLTIAPSGYTVDVTDRNHLSVEEMYDYFRSVMVEHGVTRVFDDVVSDGAMSYDEWSKDVEYQGHNF